MKALSNEITKKSVRKYITGAFAIIILLTLGILGYFGITSDQRVITPLITSIIYNVVVCGLYIYIWKLVVTYSPDSLMNLYLGGTGLRLITAMFVCLGYCYFVADKPLRMSFAIVFCIFYIVMLIFDTLYFVKFERVNRFVK